MVKTTPLLLSQWGFFISIMTDFRKMPVEPDDIEDAVRRLWQLEEFLESLIGTLYDNDFFPPHLKEEFLNIYNKKF